MIERCRHAFCRWREGPVADADRVQAHRADALSDARHADAESGCRFLAAPNQPWPTDMSPQTGGARFEHSTGEGKPHLWTVEDVWPHRIAGYSVESTMTSRLPVAAIDNAVTLRCVDGASPDGCTVHNGRGSRFRSHKAGCDVTARSTGWVGSLADDGPLPACSYASSSTATAGPTREELRIILVTWIERIDLRRRPQAGPGTLTPSSRDDHGRHCR